VASGTPTTLPVPKERFIVTEVEGFATPRKSGARGEHQGISCHVIDTAVGYRMMATFRSEMMSRTPLSVTTRELRLAYVRKRVRAMARARADELNSLASCQLQLVAIG